VGYTPMTADESDQPFPVEEWPTGRKHRLADESDDEETGWPLLLWHGQWWPVPTQGTIEEWVFDSICENPRGDEVEPDDPSSWLSILGLI
jgi:hypothetical protein